ncbi:hypothetical protein FB451DRAFT_1254835 [Mycena latifolia]|nr:hypothetical protein FB451DRAFT_1254835 [Mycena latifolia]
MISSHDRAARNSGTYFLLCLFLHFESICQDCGTGLDLFSCPTLLAKYSHLALTKKVFEPALLLLAFYKCMYLVQKWQKQLANLLCELSNVIQS